MVVVLSELLATRKEIMTVFFRRCVCVFVSVPNVYINFAVAVLVVARDSECARIKINLGRQ